MHRTSIPRRRTAVKSATVHKHLKTLTICPPRRISWLPKGPNRADSGHRHPAEGSPLLTGSKSDLPNVRNGSGAVGRLRVVSGHYPNY